MPYPPPERSGGRGLFLPVTTSTMHTVSSTVTMAMAQFRKKCLRQDQDHRIGDGIKEPVILAGEENAVEHREGPIKIQCRQQGDQQK